MADILYMAGPIDGFPDIDTIVWKDEVRSLINHEKGWIAYDPGSAFFVSDETKPDGKIAYLNSVAMYQASALVVHLPEARTAGTFMEIQHALELGIPVAWVGDDVWTGHWSLVRDGIQRCHTWAEAVGYCIGNAAASEQRRQSMQTLKVQRLNEAAILPSSAHQDDSGLDLYCAEDALIEPGDFVDVSIGIAIEAPPGIWYRIIGRSSTFRKRRLLVIEGIIDHGYRGELFVGITNLDPETPAIVKVGERLAQMIPHTNFRHIEPAWVKELSPHERGEQGFGSSGE